MKMILTAVMFAITKKGTYFSFNLKTLFFVPILHLTLRNALISPSALLNGHFCSSHYAAIRLHVAERGDLGLAYLSKFLIIVEKFSFVKTRHTSLQSGHEGLQLYYEL